MSNWHISDELMLGFAASPGGIDEVVATSIEQHLTACPSCQARLAALSARSEMDAIWAEVEDRVDRTGGSLAEKLLRRIGPESASARLLAATPTVRAGALAAVALIVTAVVLVSRVADAGAAFLVIAPLVPTALVAMSFAPTADPAGECGLATPMFGFGLLMRRALLVEAVAVGVLAVGSVFVPIDGLRALGWLLPALALSMGTLVGAVRWSAPEAAATMSAGWAAAVFVAYVAEASGDITESAVFDPAGQVAVALLAAAAGVVIVMCRQVLLQEAGR